MGGEWEGCSVHTTRASSVGRAAGRGKGCTVKDELGCRQGWRHEAEGLSIREYFILPPNMISLRCLFQPLYYDLLDTVNYSALKQELILVLII